MKKSSLCALLTISLGLVLVGCSNETKKPQASTETSQSISSSTKESSEKEMSSTEDKSQTRSEFTATLSEDAKENEKDKNQLRLILNEVTAKVDPENIIGSFSNGGVILNVATDQLGEKTSLASLKKGTEVTFVLNKTPIMTMSLPPQIPGNSIETVTSN
ncbi:hypothetical protein IGI37_001510 [Enterococcus sp. AZ194]|uniref:hypothetical protein n=1 Tax=Enterococcus sp. AZ194 TaxID=2774629 RepID=UPI003F224718